MNRFYSQQTHWVGLFRATFFFSFRQVATCAGATRYFFGRQGQQSLWLLALLLFSNSLLAQDWNQIIKTAASDRRTLTSSGRGSGDNFGTSIAIDGDYAVVGAPYESEDANGNTMLGYAGSAIVFKRVNGTWTQIKKLVAADRESGDLFGSSVAISGGLIVVGAYLEDQDATGGNPLLNSGSAYVFSQNQGGTDNWGQVKKLVATDRAVIARFGYSVAINGNTVVVGTPGESRDAEGGNQMNTAGAAYVFTQNQGGADNWGQVRKLVASDRGPTDTFGWSVGISGSLVVVGAYREDEDAAGGNSLSNSGSAYVFSQNQGGTDNWGQIKKLVAADRAADDDFGSSVAISGSLIVVGAYWENEDATGSNTLIKAGSAYVFSQNQGGTDNWGQVKKIVASDRGAGDTFGVSVGISGSTIVVGAPINSGDAAGGNMLSGAGAAYVFNQNQGGAGNWGQVKKIVASDRGAGDQFGISVGISGSLVVVGAYQDGEDATGGNTLTGAGSAYVFNQNQGGTGNWGQEQKVTLMDYVGGQQYGFSVAIDGDYAVVGAYQDYTDASSGQPLLNAGSAYVLKRQNGTWTQIKKLVAADRDANDGFGYSVAISGNTIVIGANQEDDDAAGGNTLIDAGSAYVYSQNQGGADNWGQVKKLVASDRGADDQFGISVAVSGSLIVVGAIFEEDGTGGNSLPSAGSAYVFSRDQGGANNWGQVKKLVASDRGEGDLFGYSVAISGNTIVIGAYNEADDAVGGNPVMGAGSAYVFSQNQGGTDTWGQVKKLVASDRGTYVYFGYSLAINGNTIVVGAYRDSGDAAGGNTLTFAGSAYVFSQNQGGTDNWGQVKKLVAADRGANDYFGQSVGISGSTIVVGSVGDSEDAAGGNTLAFAGSAYVFSQNQGGGGNWGQVQKLVASDRSANDGFGYSVAISGNRIVAGAYQDDEDASGANTLTNAGSAYFFESTGITLSGFIASPATICAGSVTSFSATIGNLTGSYSFTLTNGSSTTSATASSPTLSQPWTTSGSGTQSFTLIVSQNGNATTAITSLSVNATPSASILPSNPILSCTTTSLSLTATGGGTYLWSNSSPNAILPVTTPGTYSVLVTGSNSCTASATTTVSSNTVLSLSTGVTLPQANVGVVVSLSASGATSYQWTAPSTVLLTSPTTGSALSASLTTAGVQTFTLVGTTGVCSQSALVSVTALAGPDLSPIILMPEGNFAAGETKGLLMKLQE
ncbi:hypothetical protein, partial [Spirosoma litoris]